MTSSTGRAILAGGCFWGMQDLIRKMSGVLSTRVGYSGSDVPNATYRNHGTHAEAIGIVFDPNVVSYRTLLEFFFQITILLRATARATTRARATVRGFITPVPNRKGLLKTPSRMSRRRGFGRARS